MASLNIAGVKIIHLCYSSSDCIECDYLDVVEFSSMDFATS